jgi:molybdopterin-guanine dinucleotide biosynthesis protein
MVQLHASAALTPEKDHYVHSKLKAEWSVWTFWRRQKYLVYRRDLNLSYLCSILNELPAANVRLWFEEGEGGGGHSCAEV